MWYTLFTASNLYKRKGIHFLLVGFCLLVFLFLGSQDLSLPGPQYDEASHACLTIDMLHPKNPFSPTYTLRFLGHPFPFGVTPHTGALKAYVFYPFFLLFGISVETQRSVTLFLGMLALLFCYLFTRRTFGPWHAFWVLLLLSLDSALIFYSKLDAGPIVEKLMWMMFCLWIFSEWGKSRKIFFLFLGLVGSVVGIYGHIAFIWFIIASAISACLTFRKEMSILLGKRERLLLGVGGGVILVVFGYWFIGARELLKLRRLNFDGALITLEQLAVHGGIVSEVLQEGYPQWIKVRPITDFFFLTSVLFLASYHRSRRVGFLFTVSILLFLLISFTPGDIPLHRLMVLYIFLPILGGIAVAKSFAALADKEEIITSKRFFSGIILVLATLSVGGQVGLIREAIYAIEETGGVGRWSDAIYSLADYLKQKKWEKVVCIDWGFRKNLFLLTQGEVLLEEPFWKWDNEAKMEQDLTQMSRSCSGRTLFLLHPTPYWVREFPRVHRFEKIVAHAGAKAVLQKTFYERRGEPVYLAYTIERIQ